VMPLLLLYFGLWLDRVRVGRAWWALVLPAFLVSCFNVQDGLTSPFQYSVWSNWLEGTPNFNRVGKVFNITRAKKKKKRAPAASAPAASAPAASAPAASAPAALPPPVTPPPPAAPAAPAASVPAAPPPAGR
jgi:hypothetical protein